MIGDTTVTTVQYSCQRQAPKKLDLSQIIYGSLMTNLFIEIYDKFIIQMRLHN